VNSITAACLKKWHTHWSLLSGARQNDFARMSLDTFKRMAQKAMLLPVTAATI
jgi:hypothetical protein